MTPSTTTTAEPRLETAAIRGCCGDRNPSLHFASFSPSSDSLSGLTSTSSLPFCHYRRRQQRLPDVAGRAQRRQRNETQRRHHSLFLCLDLSLSDGIGDDDDGLVSGQRRHLSPSPLVFLFVVEFRLGFVCVLCFGLLERAYDGLWVG
ncbi:hypothetical protein PIB30_008812 [Stylosanthes scabra]|uniref:Uncharacterized protein n=1 Tax=Stylosanthes scabra TaxID=79078 RepID=A0ABU6X2W0_9FABA|nr:hypothetical protein [Stylosanthes scabra]